MRLKKLAKIFIYTSPFILLVLTLLFALYKSPSPRNFIEKDLTFETFNTKKLELDDTLDIELISSHPNLNAISTNINVSNYTEYFVLDIKDIHRQREQLTSDIVPLELSWSLQTENNAKVREGIVKIFPTANQIDFKMDFDKIPDSKSKKYNLRLSINRAASLGSIKSDSINIPVNFSGNYNLDKQYGLDFISSSPANYLLVLKNLNVYFKNQYIIFLLSIFLIPYFYLLIEGKFLKKKNIIGFLEIKISINSAILLMIYIFDSLHQNLVDQLDILTFYCLLDLILVVTYYFVIEIKNNDK